MIYVTSKFFHSTFLTGMDIVTERDWSVEDIMSRYGFLPQDPVVLGLQKFWKKAFFLNDFLKFDRPYPGAVRFVQHISKKAEIYYLTARNHKQMHKGTVKSLKQWHFPFKKNENLIMKTDQNTQDSLYKTQELKKLLKQSSTLLFFENEPVILNYALKTLPQVHYFWMDSTHSGVETALPKALPLGMNYPNINTLDPIP